MNENQAPLNYTDEEAYAVYTAILPHNRPYLVIRSYTVSHENQMCPLPKEGFPRIVSAAIGDWKRVNQQRWTLLPMLSVSGAYELIPSKRLDDIFSENGGDFPFFYGLYPNSGGFIELSAVGFNADKTVAAVYMDEVCGGLCGSGAFFVLKKSDGEWSLMNGGPRCVRIS